MSATTTQYLVRMADGKSYARVEPWEGGLDAARRGAASIGGYVVELDECLCEYLPTRVVADYRVLGNLPCVTCDGYGEVQDYERTGFRSCSACDGSGYERA